MRRHRLNKKEIVKKKIELRHSKLIFIKKNDELNKKKIIVVKSNSKSNLNLSGKDRTVIRAGLIRNNEYSKILNNKESISILITAFQTYDYIEECLDSIENQTYFINNNNFEVLIGIDACQDTLNKLMEIRHKYRNLKIFMMMTNMGTYITSNTLLSLVNYNNIIRFDSDDVMRPEMINEIMLLSGKFDVIKLKYINFINDINNPKYSKSYANGAIYFKKYIIDRFGGYQPWRCAADYELIKRMTGYIDIGKTDELVFYRRLHDNALTKTGETGMKSEYRKKLLSKIKDQYSLDELKIIQIINDYYEV